MKLIWKLIIAIEILIVFYLCSLKCQVYMENFKITDKKEPMLSQLELLLNPMFAKDVQYDGILKNIMTIQMKRKILNEIILTRGKKSYTINKEKIYMCLKDQNNQYYDMNMLLHVMLHEIAHILCFDEIGHTQKFYTIFDELLRKASDMKIYDMNKPLIQDYCTHNPDE